MTSINAGRRRRAPFAKLVTGVAAAALLGGLLTGVASTPAFAASTRLVNGATGSDTVPTNNPCTATPCKTITHALAVAAAGDTISVAAGTYAERLNVTKAVTIIGAGAATTIVDGGNGTGGVGTANTPVFTVSLPAGAPLTISGLTATKGRGGFGAGIEVIGGSVVLTDDVVSNSNATATVGGGGIGLFSLGVPVSLTATRVTVSGNTAVANGGGVYTAAPATFTDSTISGNTAAKQGGGVFIAKNTSVTTEVPSFTTNDTTGTTITGNKAGAATPSAATEAGGGIAASTSATLSLGPLTTVSNNNATNGGGIYVVEGATATLDGTTVSGNKANGGTVAAGGNAGGIYNSGNLTIKGHATLSANQAVASTNTSNSIRGFGGGILNASFVGGTPQLNITDSTINGGLSAGSTNAAAGGGVFQLSGATANLTRTTLSGNVAGFGAGLYAFTNASVTDSSITGNGTATATGFGGGVYSLATTNLTNTTVSTNTAILGGGIYAASGTTTITGGSLSSNLAALGGGAEVQGKGATGTTQATLIVDGTTVNGNTAAGGTSSTGGNGGAIFNNGATQVRNHAAFSGNVVLPSSASGAITGYGGAIFNGPVAANDTATLSFTDSSINGGPLPSGSTANAVAGGAIANTGNLFGASPAPVPGSFTVSNSSFVGNVASAFGGAVFAAGTGSVTGSTFDGSYALDGGAFLVGSTVATESPTLTVASSPITGPSQGMFAGGGAAVLAHASLTMTGGSISGHTAILGGGLYVQEAGTATLDGTSVTGNTATSTNSDGTVGGGIAGAAYSSGALTIRNATVSGNQAVAGSGGGTGTAGAVFSGSSAQTPQTVTLTLDADTFTGNTSTSGSAVVTASSTSAGPANSTSIRNSTFTGNSVTGTTSAGVIVAFNALTITGSTIDGNTAQAGSGGVYGASWSVAGSILSGNTGGGCGTVGSFDVPSDGGYNLADPGDSSCGFGAAHHDLSANPQLGGLASNGGPTPTQLPGPSSPVINVIPAGTAGLCDAGAVDQRGTSRPQGASCDIGAVEADLHAPTVSGPTSPTFTVGSASSFSYTTAGVPTAHLSTTGALPSGVTFVDNGDGTATLSGTPAAATGGSYPVTITATNGVTPDASIGVNVVVDQPPTVSGPNGPTFVGGSNGTATYTTTGYPHPALHETGALPSGVTFVDNGDGTATLSGTAAVGQGGVYHLTVVASNGVGSDASEGVTLTVDEGPTLSGPAATTFTVGTAGTTTYSATGVPTPHLSVSGPLPSGVTFVDNGNGTATLAGTPAAGTGGTYNLTVKATNGIGADATESVVLTVDEAPSVHGPSGAVYVALNPGAPVTFTTSGFPQAALSETGALPPGVTFTDLGDGTAQISGTAPAPGSFPITVIASNGVAPNGTLAFTLTVNPAVAITTTALPAGQVGVSYSASLAATAGLPPYSWSLGTGSLPSGLSLAPNGTISGVPTAVGTTSFQVVVRDALTPPGSDTRTLSITIGKGPTTLSVPPVLIETNPLNVIFGVARATLTGGNPAAPIAGQTITFTAGTTVLCTSVTDATGFARCSYAALSALAVILNGGVTGTYAGSTQWLPSNGFGPLIK